MLLFITLFLLVNTGIAQKKYAILFGGEDNGDPNNPMLMFKSGQSFNQQEAVWNDTYLMWELLINKGFENDNIYVLYQIGIDLPRTLMTVQARYDPLQVYPEIVPNPASMITDKPATEKYLTEILNNLKKGKNKAQKLGPTDSLYIWFYSDSKKYEKLVNSILPEYKKIRLITN